MGIIPNDLVKLDIIPRTNEIGYHLLSFQLLHALRQEQEKIIHDFHCKVSKIWSTCYITYECTNAASQGTNCFSYAVTSIQGCSPKHFLTFKSVLIKWELNSHCSKISTWPVPSRRFHMCQTLNPCVHITPLRLGTCLSYYYKVIDWETTFSFPII